jgi:hypothetical protein
VAEIQVPSIWDYLANAGMQGITNYQDAKRHVEDQARLNAGLMTQLFGAGAVDSGALQSTLGKVPSLPSVKVQPSKAEQARTIVANPQGTYSDDERRLAGLPTAAEQSVEKAKGAEADQAIRVADIAKRWIGGQHVTEEEAAIAKLPTPQEFAQMKEAKADPILQRAGDQYVDQEVLKLGGRLNPATAAKIAQTAYQQYITDYQTSGLGTLTTQQLKNAQRYFSSRAMELLIKQREDDIRLAAANNTGRSALQPQDRMFAQLTSLLENNRKNLDDFTKANPGVEVMSSKYANNEAAIPPAFKGAVARYRRLEQRESDLQTAQSQVAAGILPKNFSSLLAENVGGGAPQTDIQNRITQIKADFKNGKITRKQIQDSKLITQPQKDEILGGDINLQKK